MIVKIQRPLMAHPSVPPMALMYDQARKFQMHAKLSDVIEYFDEDEFKIYVKGRMEGKHFRITGKLEEHPDW